MRLVKVLPGQGLAPPASSPAPEILERFLDLPLPGLWHLKGLLPPESFCLDSVSY